MHLGYVARLEPISKGQDILFQVLRAEKWRKRELEVTLYGNGSSRRTLLALKEMYELTNVKFGGFSSNVEELWSQCHALVLPSRFEGLPLALVEAMLCGRPAIVTDVSGNAELIEDNVNGFVARAPKPAFLDEALERAWNRRQDWYQMGQQAAQHVRQFVPPDPPSVLTQKLLALLEKC
jgi:glycosyltransferase involved in cell wall biosynthesis